VLVTLKSYGEYKPIPTRWIPEENLHCPRAAILRTKYSMLSIKGFELVKSVIFSMFSDWGGSLGACLFSLTTLDLAAGRKLH
jgi:hypothetical protein